LSDEREFYLLICYLTIFMSIKFEQLNISSLRSSFENLLKKIDATMQEGELNTLFDASCNTGNKSEMFETRLGILTEKKFQNIFLYHFDNIKYMDLSKSKNKIYNCFSEVANNIPVSYRILLIPTPQATEKLLCLSKFKDECCYIDLIIDLPKMAIYQLFKAAENAPGNLSSVPNLHKDKIFHEHLYYIEGLIQSFFSIHSYSDKIQKIKAPISKNEIENSFKEIEVILLDNPSKFRKEDLRQTYHLYKDEIISMIKKFNSEFIFTIHCSECSKSNHLICLPCERNIPDVCCLCRKIYLTNFREKFNKDNTCFNCSLRTQEDKMLHDITVKNINKIFCILCNEPLPTNQMNSEFTILSCHNTADHFYHKNCVLKYSNSQMNQIKIPQSYFYCSLCKEKVDIRAMKSFSSIQI